VELTVPARRCESRGDVMVGVNGIPGYCKIRPPSKALLKVWQTAKKATNTA
jgi:hypothetical protein